MEDTTKGVSTQDQFKALLAGSGEEVEEIKEESEEIQEEHSEEQEDSGENLESEQEPSEAAEEEGDGVELSVVANAFGLDDADLDVSEEGFATVKVKVDGEESNVPLSELRTSYQLRKHLDNEVRQVGERRKVLDEKIATYDSTAEEGLKTIEENAKILDLWYEAQINSPELSKLRDEDFESYSRTKEQLEAIKLAAEKQRQVFKEESEKLEKDKEDRAKAWLQAEAEKLPTLIPEWKDESVANKEKQAIAEYALKRGYTEKQINAFSAMDISVFRDAIRGGKPETKKVTKKVKIARPNASGKNQQSKTKAQKQKEKKRIQDMRTGVRGAAADAFKDRLFK